MIIAITAKDKTLQAEVDPRFGRAAYFLFANTQTGQVYAYDNSKGIEASNGAGTGAAQIMAENKVNILYTGAVGPKAAEVLDKAGITYQENVTGTVEDVLNNLSVDEEAQESAGGQKPTVEPPVEGAERLAVPAESDTGMAAARSGHFGQCPFYILVDIKDNQVQKVLPLKNADHVHGGCFGPVMLLKGNFVSNIVVGGIGGRPLQGFQQIGINVFAGGGETIQDAVDLFLAGKLQTFSSDQVCGGH